MSNEIRDVTEFYRRAELASQSFDPGEQVDIAKLMRSAYMHGYAHGLLVQEALTRETGVSHETSEVCACADVCEHRGGAICRRLGQRPGTTLETRPEWPGPWGLCADGQPHVPLPSSYPLICGRCNNELV